MSKFAGLALAVDKPQRMTIIHPATRQPLRDADRVEAYLDLHSGDSETARKVDRTVLDRRLAVRGRTKLRASELESEAPERLAALTAGWHLVDLDGNAIDVAFSPENARELFREPAMSWLREQAEEFVGDRGNFLKASSTS